MAKKHYPWTEGAELGEHSKRKHEVLATYFHRYLLTRCQHRHQTRFKLTIVDGFAGGGVYKKGEPGSPLVFIDGLCRASDEVNEVRRKEEREELRIQCRLVLNDIDPDTIALLRDEVDKRFAQVRQTHPTLDLEIEYHTLAFERFYWLHRTDLFGSGYANLLFNLDQYGYAHVKRSTLVDIMNADARSVEVFFTFAIQTLIAFLEKKRPGTLAPYLDPLDVHAEKLDELEDVFGTKRWLGTAERLVFESYKSVAPYVSPFSIHNPAGWRYWFIHLAKNYRARQVYNDVLHASSTVQAHYGRVGLRMLSYDPRRDDDASLYLFEPNARDTAVDELHDDIPKLIAEVGDAISVTDFYATIYNATPAHAADIHRAIMENPDLEVRTERGGLRRSAGSIATTDVLHLKRQSSFFPTFRDRASHQK